MSAKSRYIEWCRDSKEVPIFHNPFWLDLVGRDSSWDVVLDIAKDGAVRGVLPYFYSKKYGLNISLMPKLTPYLGPLIIYPEQGFSKYQKKLSYSYDVLENLEKQLPRFSYFAQNFTPNQPEWYPFYKKGYEQTSRNTFIIHHQDVKMAWNQLSSDVKNKINKASKQLSIEESTEIDTIYNIHRIGYEKAKISIPYSKSFLNDLINGVLEQHAGRSTVGITQSGEVIAHQLVVWDSKYYYNLVLSSNPETRHTGVVQLLLWDSIKKALEVGLHYNFEGTMLPNVEPIFRRFGGLFKPYHHIYRDKNKIIKLLRIALRN